MFITDGIESDYVEEKKLFAEFNGDHSTRVFTYLVGRKKSPDKKTLLKMACENNGYFYTLETLGNVWDTVLEYLHAMSRPLSKNDNAKKKIMYSPVYLDSTGLGMVMSISTGVFSGDKNPTFVGVAGTDVTIKSLSDTIPHSKLGVFGHAFAITNNGFILLHPMLRLQTGTLPSPPNILIEDLERAVFHDNIIRLKKRMIDREPDANNNTFNVFFSYDDDERKLSIINSTYNYRFINGSEFSAGIVMSNDEQERFDYDLISIEKLRKGVDALNAPKVNLSIPNITIDNYTFIKVAPWNFLPELIASDQKNHPYSVKVYPSAEELYYYLKDVKDLLSHSTGSLINNLLVSAGIVADDDGDDDESWIQNQVRNNRETYESVFTATSAGYLKFFTYSNTSKPFDRNILKTPIFQHAIANPTASITFSAPYSDSNQPLYDQLITAVVPIRKERKLLAGKNIKPF